MVRQTDGKHEKGALKLFLRLKLAGQVGPRSSCRCQIIRSVGQWSAGTSQTEGIHNAYCSLIENAKHFVYIENQFFISGLSGDERIQNRVLEALYRRIIRAHKEEKSFRVIVVIPLLPGFQGGVDDTGEPSVRAVMHWKYRTISRELNSSLHNLYDMIGPRANDYISFHGLRAYGRLSDGGSLATNQTNTTIYQDVFAWVPNDLIHTRAAIRQSMGYWKEKLGHMTIDLGIAPGKLEPYQNGDVKATDPIERLGTIRGHFVSFHLDFMCQEDLRPVFNESEYYASTHVFH
ncbi:hypothetical protein MKX03_035768 [Papaver bracteatum]|nr:hypothetical protein MKX03_035768 [Papaver bracteatum]